MPSQNLQETYIKFAKEFTKQFTKNSNVVGITLSGGVSRGTGDKYSEVDISFYLKDIKNKKNLPPKGDFNVNGVWFEFKFYDIKEEQKRKWGMVDRWDGKYAKILFERNKVVTKLFKKKISFEKGEKENLIKENNFIANWSIQLAEVSEYRGDLRQAHLLINGSLDAMINTHFLKNNEFIPYFKWKYYYFAKLKKPDKKTKDALLNLFLIKDFSSKELWRRIRALNKIAKWDEKPMAHYQNLKKVDDFINSLKKGVEYSSPWK